MENFGSTTPRFMAPYRPLRQPIALNLLKWMVLGEEHLPGQNQAAAILHAIGTTKEGLSLEAKAWRAWFGKKPRRAHGSKIAPLDSYFSANLHQPRWTLNLVEPHGHFFRDLIDGGLAASIMKPITTKEPDFTLLRRALSYKPLSRIHLHVDAIESAALSEDNGDASWEVVKATAAQRVLGLIHSRWSPRDGTVYSEFTSDLELRLQDAGADEQDRIRKRYERGKPNLFDIHLKRPPCPSWSMIGIEADIAPLNVHRMLLALAGDANFLVADRLQVWALDLVSAALAMHALAWTDRHTTHGGRMSHEMIYWRAFDAVFFSEEPEGATVDAIAAAFEVNKTEFTEAAADNLYRARESYWHLLGKLNIDRQSLRALVARCWRVRPVKIHGSDVKHDGTPPSFEAPGWHFPL